MDTIDAYLLYCNSFRFIPLLVPMSDFMNKDYWSLVMVIGGGSSITYRMHQSHRFALLYRIELDPPQGGESDNRHGKPTG